MIWRIILGRGKRLHTPLRGCFRTFAKLCSKMFRQRKENVRVMNDTLDTNITTAPPVQHSSPSVEVLYYSLWPWSETVEVPMEE